MVSLAPREIPDEIKHLLGNTKKLAEDMNDIVSFHTGHYKSIIKLAQAKIIQLTERLDEAEGEIRRFVIQNENRVLCY